MPKIFVIADDLTGAAEIGGIAIQFGLQVKIVFNLNGKLEPDPDVLILDTNSRSLKPCEAKKLLEEKLFPADFNSFHLIYKKVDSVLRGPVETEIETVLSFSKHKRSILIPTNPSKGRMIKGGNYFIDNIPINETGFRFDPEYPRKSASIKDLIIDFTENTIIANSYPLKMETLEGKIFIPSVASINELQSITDQIVDENILFAGGSDFFTALVKKKFSLIQLPSREKRFSGNKHFILGSNSESSHRTISKLSIKEYVVFHLPGSIFENSHHNSPFKTWISDIVKALKNGNNIVLASPEKMIEDIDKVSMITEKLVSAFCKISDHIDDTAHLFIEGGETASMLFRKMEWNELEVVHSFGNGTVTLRNAGSNQLITIKPGSYNWSEYILY